MRPGEGRYSLLRSFMEIRSIISRRKPTDKGKNSTVTGRDLLLRLPDSAIIRLKCLFRPIMPRPDF